MPIGTPNSSNLNGFDLGFYRFYGFLRKEELELGILLHETLSASAFSPTLTSFFKGRGITGGSNGLSIATFGSLRFLHGGSASPHGSFHPLKPLMKSQQNRCNKAGVSSIFHPPQLMKLLVIQLGAWPIPTTSR